jgi:hypothetical protein
MKLQSPILKEDTVLYIFVVELVTRLKPITNPPIEDTKINPVRYLKWLSIRQNYMPKNS